jgi:predicted  nucleic acid-binding Zn-ribbon protein
MPKVTHEPGPGRSTSEAAFNELTKEIAQRNERAHQAAHKLRAANDRKRALRRRQEDAS